MQKICFLIFGFFLLVALGIHAQLPTESQIVFIDLTVRDIFLIQANGDGLRNVTASVPGAPTDFSLSPDGQKVAFEMWNKEVTDADIYVVNIDGSHPINLIQRPDCWDTHPAWSPDGRQIAFKSNRDGGSHLFVMNPDGTGIRNLTIGAGLPPVGCSLPSWSPDSRQIAFTADLTLLFTINADGTDLKQLPVNAWDTAWSPDGRLLAFTSSRDGPASDIYLLNLQSNEVKRLTKTGGQNIFNQYPSWLPDGNGLLFTSSRDLTAVWYMEADGSHQKRVWRESHGHLILMPRILPNPQAILRQEKDWTTWGTIKTRLYE